MAKPALNTKKVLERLRSNEAVSGLAGDLGLRDAEVQLARELVRKLGEHQAAAAGRLPDQLAYAVVEAAVQIEHADFLKALAESGSKAAAGAAMRGLAILRSRGIVIDVEQPGEAVFKPDAGKPEELPCFLSVPDGRGERLLFLPRVHRGGLQVLSVIFSDQVGVIHVEADEVSRKSYRRLRDDLVKRAGARSITLIEVSAARALGCLAAARELSPRLAIQISAVLATLSGDPKDAASPLKAQPPLPEPQESQRLAESAQLHREPEARVWMPEEEALRALSLKLEEVSQSSLYIDEKQREDQAARELETAVTAHFTPPRCALWSERLFELAEALQVTGRPEASERAAATARALGRGAASASIPFCRELFEKLIEKAPPSATPSPATTDGGLIVPGAPQE